MRSWANYFERVLRSFCAWIFTVVYFPPFALIYVLTFKMLPDESVSYVVRLWGRTALKIVGVELEYQNPSTLEDRCPRVLMVNHQSALDMLWGAAIVPPGMTAIAKKEIIWIPVFNLMWWALDLIRIDRQNTRKAIDQLRGVAEQINRKRKGLFVSPEGTRSLTGEIGRFKKGPFHIAIEGQIPIYPVVISGAFDLLPKGKLIPKKGKVKMYFLPPVSTQGKTLDDIEELIETVRNQMVQKKAEIDRPSSSPSQA